eukprot:TRINITY_DN67817_c4_g9_i1.p2 TRINITY_DN67817_c4_g9~~TRINITY_DN67817_c4_g9_i1.p2  ORF type:complete len:101 (+),score=6.51 TRINITY_DN67817_c4_g9_i1:243-545(+)
MHCANCKNDHGNNPTETLSPLLVSSLETANTKLHWKQSILHYQSSSSNRKTTSRTAEPSHLQLPMGSPLVKPTTITPQSSPDWTTQEGWEEYWNDCEPEY